MMTQASHQFQTLDVLSNTHFLSHFTTPKIMKTAVAIVLLSCMLAAAAASAACISAYEAADCSGGEMLACLLAWCRRTNRSSTLDLH